MYEPATTADHPRSGPVRALARRRPITMFLVIALGLSWPVMAALLAAGEDVCPAFC
jgi:nitrate reductase NapE component